MDTRYQDHMDAALDALRPAWAKIGEALFLGGMMALYVGSLAAQVVWLAKELGIWQ
jgi:hypothetical protein